MRPSWSASAGAISSPKPLERYFGLEAAARSYGRDNKAVANVAGGDRRLDPRQIVARVARESPVLLWLPRLALGVVASFIVLIGTANILGSWSLLPASIAAAATACAANGRRLFQIGAEIAGESGRSVPVSATPSNTDLVDAINICPDDWICSHAKYKKMLEDEERKERRQRELSERRRTALGLVETTRNGAGQSVAEALAIPLELVIAVSPDEKEITLRIANGDVLCVPHDERFHRRRPKVRRGYQPAIEEASLALSELLAVLAKSSLSESYLINSLVKRHSDVSVHRALRAALSRGLIDQHAGPGRIFREACAIFSPRMDTGLRRKSVVSLSRAGKVWVQSGNTPPFRKRGGGTYGPKSSPGTIHNIFIGGQTFHTVVLGQTVGESGDRPPQGQKTSEGQSVVTEGQGEEANNEDSANYIMAWSAGVSATGAGLAALFLTGEAPWQRALFFSLILISGFTFVILIFTGLPKMMSWRSELRHSPPRRDASSNPDPTGRRTD